MKKFLFLTNYFPPAGLAGSVRAYNYARFFPQFGYEPFVITANPIKGWPLDFSLLEDIKSLKIKRINIFYSPFKIKSGKGRGREIFRYFSPFFREALKIIKENKIDFIFVTLPPFSLLKVAFVLKLRFKLPIVCEIRDPADFESGKRFKKFIKNFENYVDIFIGSHEYVLRSFNLKGYVVPGGFYEFEKKEHKGFNIIYSGSLKNAEKSFERFLKTTKKVDYKIYLLGPDYRSKDKRVISHGYIPYKDLKKFYEIADLFVIFRDKDCKSYIPLKFFEYSGSKVPILCYFNKKSYLFKYLEEHNKGRGFVWGEEDKLLYYLYKIKNGEVSVAKFGKSWKQRVFEIVNIINEEIFNRNHNHF